MKEDRHDFMGEMQKVCSEIFVPHSVQDTRTEEQKRIDTIEAYKGGIIMIAVMLLLAGGYILLAILNPELAQKAGNWSFSNMAEEAREQEEKRQAKEEEEFKQKVKAIIEEDPDFLKKIDINIDNIENVENFNVETKD